MRIERDGKSAISSQTLTVDNTAPQPTFSPASWSSEVATDVTLRISFNESITYPGTQLAVQDGDEVQEMVSLRKASDDSDVDITAHYEAATNNIQVNPTELLEDSQSQMTEK